MTHLSITTSLQFFQVIIPLIITCVTFHEIIAKPSKTCQNLDFVQSFIGVIFAIVIHCKFVTSKYIELS